MVPNGPFHLIIANRIDHSIIESGTSLLKILKLPVIFHNFIQINTYLILPCTSKVYFCIISYNLIFLIFNKTAIGRISSKPYGYHIFTLCQNSCRNIIFTRRVSIGSKTNESSIYKDRITVNHPSHIKARMSSHHRIGNTKLFSIPYTTFCTDAILLPVSRHIHCCPICVIKILLLPTACSLILLCQFHTVQSSFIKKKLRKCFQMFLTYPAFYGRAS